MQTKTDQQTSTAGHRPSKPLYLLLIGALGVVFGDIGTSPLYTMRAVLSSHGDLAGQDNAVLGVLSMITWCLIIIVAITYISLITRADNDGEGGILSLATYVIRRTKASKRTAAIALVLAMLGASLFFGDSLITPAISVLSAVEGVSVVNPDFSSFALPAAVVVLTLLFLFQRNGTERIGRLFGPVMAFWFVTMGALGIPWIISNPQVLKAISPTYAIAFAIDHPGLAFLSLGSAVLAVTGAEALYADLGHFGRKPIVFAWFLLVFPCLLLNYYGQGAMTLDHPEAINNPFFNLAPDWGRVPLVILATLATVIASQAVISGAFSVARQASRLSLLPRFKVIQTSEEAGGQIYIPAVNFALYFGVLILVVFMQSSDRLASAYGIAITATLLLELTLFLVFARLVWHWHWAKIATMATLVGSLELLLFAANTPKIISGGWFPIAVSAAVILLMTTWRRGAEIMFGKRHQMEGPIEDFIDKVHTSEVARIPGVAVYLNGDTTTAPLALRSSMEFTHALHEHVVIITVKHLGVPHVDDDLRVCIDSLGDPEDGIVQVIYKVGFKDSQDVPHALYKAIGKCDELKFDPSEAWYVLSVFRIEPDDSEDKADWPKWQRALFRYLERMSANRTQVFHLPQERTIIAGEEVYL